MNTAVTHRENVVDGLFGTLKQMEPRVAGVGFSQMAELAAGRNRPATTQTIRIHGDSMSRYHFDRNFRSPVMPGAPGPAHSAEPADNGDPSLRRSAAARFHAHARR